MELIKRYVYAVGKWLPRKKRNDIEKELESSIYDALEARFGKKDEYTDEETAEILKELGSPWKVASAYTWKGDRLIGQELLQVYIPLTLTISGAVCIGLIVSFMVGIIIPGMTFGKFLLRLLELIPQLLVSIAAVVGFTTIIFTLIEHNAPGYRVKDRLSVGTGKIREKDGFNPHDLPAVPKGKQRVKLWEPIVGIIFTVAFIVLFNMFPGKIGIYYTSEWGSGWQFVPIFSDTALRAFLPFWNAVWGFSLVFNIFLIIKLRWTIGLRIFDIVISLLNVAVLGIMISGPELIDMHKLLSDSSAGVAKALTPVAELFNYSIDIILIVLLVATCLGILGKIVNIFKAENYLK